MTALLLAPLAGGQVRPDRFRTMPPEIVASRDTAQPHVSLELDNAQLRVVRTRMGAFATLRSGAQPGAGQQGALLVAVTALDLRMVASDGKTRDTHLSAGRTTWLDGPASAFQNLAAEECEFLVIEAKR
jgi:hypothetical protein